MPRIRSIKPEFPQSESMGLVSREARLTFLMLWTLADDEGRLRGHSRALASLLFPYDDDAKGLIDGWLDELERQACIVRYTVNGSHYVSVCNWLEHQKIDKPSASKIPPPDDALAKPREASRILPVGSGSGIGSGSKERKGEDAGAAAPAALPPLSHAELHEQSPREQLFEYWRDVAEQHGVLEPLTRTPKECHQAASLLDVHRLDALRGAVTAFWDSAAFDGKRSFGMFANQAPQLVAHVKAGKPYPFGAPPRVAEKAAREAKLDAWTPPVPRQAVAR